MKRLPPASIHTRSRLWSRLWLRLLLCLPLAAAAWGEPPVAEPHTGEPLKVMASIKPLALLVQEIGGDRVEVITLVKPGQTPHDFAFRVSDRQRLSAADLLVWVGPVLEPYLAELAGRGVELSMAAVLDVTQQSGHSHGDSGHNHGDEHDHHHKDQHLWLNPAYGKMMATAIAEKLALLDPQYGTLFRESAARIGEQLLAIPVRPVAENEQQATPSRQYAVVHQAFDYFLAYFPYSKPMVLTPIPELSPGARQLWQASQRLQPGDCLMVESRSPGKWVQTFSARNQLQLKLVDIMGYEETVNTYTELLEGVKSVFDECAP